MFIFTQKFLCSLLPQAEECITHEEDCVKHLRVRIDHLKEHADDSKSAVLLWKKKRLDRMIVDHCLRSGCYETAQKLAKDAQLEVPPRLSTY